MDKTELRKYIAQQKKNVSAEYKKNYAEMLWTKLENDTCFANAKTILLYHSLPDEVDTHLILQRWGAHKQLILPVVVDNDLVLRVYHGEGCTQTGSYGIKEPEGSNFTAFEEIDLALIPGVAFDKKGNRLGRGKGYYDRLLSKLKSYHIPTIGIAFDFQMVDAIPTEPHDVVMNRVL